MLLRYRGSEGMLAWAFHRISGVAIWLFVILHIVDIFLVGAAPDVYDSLLFIYATPPGIIMDFWPRMTRYQKELWYLNWGLFVLIGVPVTIVIAGQFIRSLERL